MSKKEEIKEEKEILQEENIKEEVEAKPKEKKNKIIFIIIGIIVMLLLCAGAFILGTKFANHEDNKNNVNNNNEEKENKENEEQEDEEDINLEQYKYQVHLYATKEGYVCGNKSDYCTKKVLSIPAETKDAAIGDYSTNEKDEPTFVIILDGTYKVYDVKKDKLQETQVEVDGSPTLHTNKEYTEVYGFVYDSGETSTYYNLLTKKEMYKNKYENLTPIFGKYIEGFITNDEEDSEDDETLLLSTAEEKVELSTTGMCRYYNVYEFEEGEFFAETEGCFGAGYSNIYNKNKKIIVEQKEETEWSVDTKGNLYILSNNKVEKYNTSGKLLSTSKTYSKPLHLIREYILYVENDNIYLSDGKEATKIGKWEKEFYYHSMISGYYEEGSLTNENEKDAGIYLIFEYGQFEEGPGVEYYFNPETKKVKKYELEYIGGYAKPVLYLYPEEKTDITVNFEKEENLTTTYPKFKDEWKVTAYPNGDLYDENKMGGQLNSRLIDKIVKVAGQGESGNARLESILDKYGIKGDQRKAIMSSFGSADQAILGAKDTDNYKEGQLQLLSDKYGINLLGKHNSDIVNYLKLIEHDKTLRYGEDSDPTIERDEKYQNSVVTLLEEINNNK